MGPWSPNTLPGSSLGCHGEAPPFRVSVSSYRESKAQGPRRTLPRPLATFLTSTVSKVLFLGVLRQIHLTQLFRGHGAAPGPHEGDLSPSSDGRPRVGRVELHHPLAQVPFAVPGQQSLMGSMLFLLIFWNPQYHHFGWVGSDPVGGGVCQRGTKETPPTPSPNGWDSPWGRALWGGCRNPLSPPRSFLAYQRHPGTSPLFMQNSGQLFPLLIQL